MYNSTVCCVYLWWLCDELATCPRCNPVLWSAGEAEKENGWMTSSKYEVVEVSLHYILLRNQTNTLNVNSRQKQQKWRVLWFRSFGSALERPPVYRCCAVGSVSGVRLKECGDGGGSSCALSAASQLSSNSASTVSDLPSILRAVSVILVRGRWTMMVMTTRVHVWIAPVTVFPVFKSRKLFAM